jgi:hypothetical protein
VNNFSGKLTRSVLVVLLIHAGLLVVNGQHKTRMQNSRLVQVWALARICAFQCRGQCLSLSAPQAGPGHVGNRVILTAMMANARANAR